ncbi:VOC family protein [Aquabacter cavernae]|uniref:VOC family protein n=1 Tax=Aquabacter cavernae TaxID=2496029 RepID=UPI0013E00908|nr:VOC family protein [Aquabacter cavernae]
MTLRITRLAFATFGSPDPAQLADYYASVIGLSAMTRADGGVHLASPSGETCVLVEAGEAPVCTGLGFETAPDVPLEDVARWLGAQGIASAVRTDPLPGIARMLRFTDFKGTRIDVFNTPPPAVPALAGAGIGPRKLGHVAFYVADIQQAVAFYRDILGFRVSDWMEDFFVFMRCGPDHHTCNFISSANRGMHHMAFELADWAHVKAACDGLSRAGLQMTWGPGRHGPGHNIFTYHRNPQNQIIELFTELDVMSDEASGAFDPRPWHRDAPQRPKVWRASEATNLWGDGPPPGHRS